MGGTVGKHIFRNLVPCFGTCRFLLELVAIAKSETLLVVFLEMGGDFANLDVRLLDGTEVCQNAEWQLSSSRETLPAALESFDPKKARCFSDYDTQRLQDVIDVIGHERIT